MSAAPQAQQQAPSSESKGQPSVEERKLHFSELKSLPQSELKLMFVDVWADNMMQAFRAIQDGIDDFAFVAMDTEFPGVMFRPVGSFKHSRDYRYQTLKANVDILKLVQLGLVFCDAEGFVMRPCCFQFHFQFDLDTDFFAPDAVALLKQSGIDFERLKTRGIDVVEFAETLMCSGVVLNDDVRWLSFHAGYDYGYLMKLLTCKELPKTETEFFELLRLYFPGILDLKYIMKSCAPLSGGLQSVATALNVGRIGRAHQAGSDSLLTLATYFKLKEVYFENEIEEDKYLGIVFGLGKTLK